MERQAEGPLSFYQRFLRITFHTFRCSCARAHLTRMHIHIREPNTYAHVYTRVLFPFCPPLVSVDHLSYLPSPSTTPFSFCLSSSFCAAFVLSSSLLYIRVCTCALSQSSYARFHVARLYAPAARGRLCTWVNGKMSFETFLGRSRSPHCQSYTREIPLSRKRSPLRVVRSDDAPVARQCRWYRAKFSVESK